MEILLFGLLVFSSWVIVTGWFFAYSKAYELKEKGVKFTWVVIVPLYIFLAVGLLFDVIFNMTVGTFHFREIPKELTFSKRVSRHYKSGSGIKYNKALRWLERINKIMPFHIKE